MHALSKASDHNCSIGYSAQLNITTANKNGLTIAKKTFYSAPYKLTTYFRQSNGGIEYILMNASAGIMANDCYQTTIHVGNNSQLTLSSQSFEKIHNMDGGSANRTTTITIGSNAYFKYIPLPTIPFAGSAFTNTTTVSLKDTTSKLIYFEVLSCGRYLTNERFQYRYYKSLLDIIQSEKLVFRDQTQLIPATQNVDGFGLFEGYSHLANIVIFGLTLSDDCISQINTLISSYNIDGGTTTLLNNGYLVRAFANGAEALIQFSKDVISLIEHKNKLN